MKGKCFRWGSMIAVMAFAGFLGSSMTVQGFKSQEGIPPEEVAEFIHSVIEADRTLYTTHVVQRMNESGKVKATEAWKRETALPLPAQLLALSGLRVKGKRTGLEYRLASLWPIYEKNRPTTEFERTGLEAVAGDPDRPYTGIITKEDGRYFTAIYADKAISPACVECHNKHALSPKRNYKLNNVMGGVIISFPLRKTNKNQAED